MIRWFLSLLHEHSPILIMLSVVFALGLFLVWALVLSRVEWFAESNDCSVDAVPMSPELLNIVQDPSTLTVTAEVRDNSDNEQWFALERTLITRFNQVVVVGTDVVVENRYTEPINTDSGRIVQIDDRGIVENQKPTPGLEYVYIVRAWNCWGPSEPSNDITILSLFPAQ